MYNPIILSVYSALRVLHSRCSRNTGTPNVVLGFPRMTYLRAASHVRNLRRVLLESISFLKQIILSTEYSESKSDLGIHSAIIAWKSRQTLVKFELVLGHWRNPAIRIELFFVLLIQGISHSNLEHSVIFHSCFYWSGIPSCDPLYETPVNPSYLGIHKKKSSASKCLQDWTNVNMCLDYF